MTRERHRIVRERSVPARKVAASSLPLSGRHFSARRHFSPPLSWSRRSRRPRPQPECARIRPAASALQPRCPSHRHFSGPHWPSRDSRPSPRHLLADSPPPKSGGEKKSGSELSATFSPPLLPAAGPASGQESPASGRSPPEKWQRAHRHFLAATFRLAATSHRHFLGGRSGPRPAPRPECARIRLAASAPRGRGPGWRRGPGRPRTWPWRGRLAAHPIPRQEERALPRPGRALESREAGGLGARTTSG